MNFDTADILVIIGLVLCMAGIYLWLGIAATLIVAGIVTSAAGIMWAQLQTRGR